MYLAVRNERVRKIKIKNKAMLKLKLFKSFGIKITAKKKKLF